MPTTGYHFLPYLRRGYQPEAPFDANRSVSLPQLRVDFVTVGIADDNTQDEQPVSVPVKMLHPGYIIGIDTGQIIRRTPEPGTQDFTPNLVASIEFNAPDLPWLFSPVRASDTHQALPWLMLIVIERTADTALQPSGRRPLPSLSVPVAELPDPRQAYAWAHVQVTGRGTDDHPQVADFQQSSLRTRSRLISPRNILQNRQYIAAVVPLFEVGRLAGLGREFTVESTLDFAWQAGSAGTVELPVYTSWEFGTGLRGDFEYLVRQLTPRNLNQPQFDIGSVDVDVTNPGPSSLVITDETAPRTVRMEGALRKIGMESPAPSDYVKSSDLKNILQTRKDPETAFDIIGPPVYGSWHALRWMLEDTSTTGEEWLYTLNLYPGFRLAASLGAKIVRQQQENLMTSAWQQVGRINEVNRLLRLTQLSHEVLKRKQAQIEAAMQQDNGWRLLFTGAMHGRVLFRGETVWSTVNGTRLPVAFLSPAFRRLMRATGQAGEVATAGELVDDVASGRLDPAPVTEPAINTPDMSIEELCQKIQINSGENPPDDNPIDPQAADIAEQLASLLDTLQTVLLALLTHNFEQYQSGHREAMKRAIELRQPLVGLAMKNESSPIEGMSSALTQSAADNQMDILIELLETTILQGTPDAERRARLLQGLQKALFIVEQLLGYFDVDETGTVETYLERLVCDSVPQSRRREAPNIGQLVAAFDFEQTLIRRTGTRIGGVDLSQRDAPFDRIMVYPEFPQPVYRDLKNLSESYLLPGVDEIAPDTVGILETNPAFIEAFMTGLNHEMASELQWRRYPTDRRGSYFRQFWDPATRIPPPQTDEEARDISKIHTWDDKVDAANNPVSSPLGSNNINGADDANIVLILRSSLLERYPNTTIYAARAVLQGDGTRKPIWLGEGDTPQNVQPERHKFPLFQARIDPDITCLGFALTAEEATGEDDPSSEGWFIVLEEAPGDIRFGLDVADEPADTVLCLQPHDIPGIASSDSSADVAMALWQTSVRVAIHADDLIPIERNHGDES